MKTLLNIIIVAIFGVEVCSPFMIGYLNNRDKKMKVNNEFISKREKIEKIYRKVAAQHSSKNWKSVDYSENSYSDSKALKIKE